MAKAKGSKSSFDVKQFLLEKGDKIGLIVGGLGLALMAAMGVHAASKAASPATLSKGLRDGATAVENKLQTGTEVPENVVLKEGSQAFVKVKVTDYPTPHDLFNVAANIVDKRVKPAVLPLEGGQAICAIGGAGIYEINGDSIAILEGRPPAINAGPIKNKFKKPGAAAPVDKGAAPAAPQAPTPTAPAGKAKGPGGGGPTGGGRFEEKGLRYVPLDSEEATKSELAINLRPTRMAIVRGVVPYKAQVGKYLQALRIENDSALEADKSAPVYDGFEVERLIINSKGEVVNDRGEIVKDVGQPEWQPFNHIDNYRELYKLTAKWEEEDLFKDFVPTPLTTHKLYMSRPKLETGGYAIQPMTQLLAAMEELKKSGPPKVLTPKQLALTGTGDIFDTGATVTQPPAGAGPIAAPPGASGLAKAGGGPPPKGAGGPPGAPAQPKNNTMPVWILQLVDPTIMPGYAYRYRIRLRIVNPNFGRHKDVASPGLADEHILMSDWFEIPDTVEVPRDEYLYASGETHVNEDGYGTPLYDSTKLRFHRWQDYIRREKDSPTHDPVAAWVITDIDAKRGQYVHQEKRAKIPLWSMPQGNYIIKQKFSMTRGLRPTENVTTEFRPKTETLVVDFHGGKGKYRLLDGKPVDDECAQEVLLITGDGQAMVVTARNTAVDKEEPSKKAREDAWTEWMKVVEMNTMKVLQ